jgi:hypothetical protein
MRKVLLTTTALVALGGVSAASALDIGGFQRFTYSAWDDTGSNEGVGVNDSTMTNQTRLNFSHQITSDSGLTGDMFFRIQDMAEAYEGLQISGDFGAIAVGNYWTAGGFLYNSQVYNGTLAFNTGQTFTGVNTSAAAAIADGGNMGVNYTSPNIGGLTVMITKTDAGTASDADALEVGAQYATTVGGTGITAQVINANSNDSTGAAGDESDRTEYGASFRNGPFALHLTREEQETKSTAGVVTAEIKTNEVSGFYQAADDLQIGVISVKSEDKISTNTPDLKMMVYGANYTIMPGMRLQASYTDFDYQGATDNKGSSTTVRLRMDF